MNATLPAQLSAAAAMFRNGDIAGALAMARRLAAIAPGSADAAQFLATCLGRAGQGQDAEREFARALALAPGHAHALANHAAFLRGQGRRGEAAEAWRRAVAAAPRNAQAWVELGSVELELGRAEEAITALQRALSLAPSAAAWQLTASARRALGDLESAEIALRNAVALDGGSATAWINLGAVLRLRGRADEALESYAKARELGFRGPELPDATVGALIDAGRTTEAIELARAVTSEHPGFAQGHRTLANLLWEFGPALCPEEDPIAGFTAAADMQPGNSGLQLACIGFLLEARRAAAALERVQALRAKTDHPHLWRLHADALEQLGQSAEAGVLYEKLYQSGNRTVSLLNAYTRHLLCAGRWEVAAELAKEATLTDPRNQEAWAYLGTAWRLLGDPREMWLCDYERFIALVDVDTPEGFAGRDAYLAALDERLGAFHKAAREPVLQSLRGGSQTPGQLFGRGERLVEAARLQLQQATERWLTTLPRDAGHPFLSRNTGRVRITGSWSVRLWSSGRHVNHVHSAGWISSAFYVALPPAMRAQPEEGRTDGCIQFGQPPVELGLDLGPRRVLRPEPGKLALFPSYMWHGTVPFEDENARTTIAFDMVPSGQTAPPASD